MGPRFWRSWVQFTSHGEQGWLAGTDLATFDDGSAGAELGVMLVPGVHGNGLARELCDAVFERVFGPAARVPLTRVWARHAPGHDAAARVLAAAGMTRDADMDGAVTWGIERARWLATRRGSLACVGVGMMLGAHFAPRARTHVEQADTVFALVSDPVVELWLQRLRPDLHSLQPFYGDGSPTVYLLMPDTIVESRGWKAQVPFLARHFRVVVSDPRGNGGSGTPPTRDGFDDRLMIGDAVISVTGLRNPCQQINGFRDGLLKHVVE